MIAIVRSKGYDGVGGETRGEAVAVKIADRGVLFLLLDGLNDGANWPIAMPHRAFSAQFGGVDMVNSQKIERLTKLTGTSVILSRKEYPLMVKFYELSDPTSLHIVDPTDLSTSFAPGVTLRNVSVEITDDSVTSKIKEMLPWVKTQRGSLTPSDGNSPASLLNRITDGDFRPGFW